MSALFRPRRAFVEAVGRMLNQLGGGLLTRLTAALAPDGTTAFVESTFEFPPSGVVVIAGELMAYGSTAAGELRDLVRAGVPLQTHPVGEVVALYTGDGRAIWSDIDRGWAMLFVDTAEGPYLDVIGRAYGVPRWMGVEDAIYRALIKLLAYQAGRGTRTALGDFLDAIGVCPQPLEGVGALDRAARTLTVPGANFGATWQDVRLELRGTGRNGGVFRVVGRAAPDTLVLDALPGRDHLAADLDDEADVAWSVIPWDLLEDPARPGHIEARISCAEPDDPEGVGYLHMGEPGVVVDLVTVEVADPIRQVLGVWAADDTDRLGQNYATGNAFAGTTITLDTPLPGLGAEVIVDYGSVAIPDAGPPTPGPDGEAGPPATAQVAELFDRNEGDRYPLYLGDRIAFLRVVLPLITVAGVRSSVTARLLTL